MSRPVVLLVQLPIPPLGAQPLRGNVPLAAGYLKLMARSRGLEESFDIEILPAEDANRMGDAMLVDAIVARAPFLVGFTCYLWNIDRTLWIAARVKERLPQTLVLLGGPEITRDNDWVLSSDAFDFAAIGEGEQTFVELLSHLGGTGGTALANIAGLAWRNGTIRMNGPRRPLPELDPISSPYLAGILDAGDQEQLLLETIRGCIFKCKFCYYPKAYDGLYYVSADKILANLDHARTRGAREVYLLDPTLNQRRDFTEFLALLGRGNAEGSLEYHAELRGEGIKPEHARAMSEANFKEVEIGLQSIDPVAQEMMDRRNSLKAFERGVRALQSEGVRVKVDLIVGLPGDTADSVRRGMHYLAENRLYDDIQVFQLSVLPGTAFRQEAVALGLEFQSRPPYYVLNTPALNLDTMLDLLAEAEDVFDTEFDPRPEPVLEFRAESRETGVEVLRTAGCQPALIDGLRIDLDHPAAARAAPVERAAQAFTLWFRARNLYRGLPAAERWVRAHLAANPFSTLAIVLETGEDFPFNVFEGLRGASARAVNIYLDRFYEFTPGAGAGALRFITLFPAARRGAIPADWCTDAAEHTEMMWR